MALNPRLFKASLKRRGGKIVSLHHRRARFIPPSLPPSAPSSQLLSQASQAQARSDLDAAHQCYIEAVEAAYAEREKNPADPQAQRAYQAIEDAHRAFLQVFVQEKERQASRASASSQGPRPMSLVPTPLPARHAKEAGPSVSHAAQSAQVDRFFEWALFTFKRLAVSNNTRAFLVYAHDNPKRNPQARASIAKDFIKKLSGLHVNLYSDQTPMGQPHTVPLDGSRREQQQLEDILTSQLC
jgi:hypothetical protein